MKKRSFLFVASLSILSAASCQIGRVAYLQPAERDVAAPEKGEVIAEHCFQMMPGSLDEAQKAYKAKTGKSSWENVNITYHMGFAEGCYKMTPGQEGKPK